MDRRQFNRKMIQSLSAVPGLIIPAPLLSFNNEKKMKKPARLQKGDTVALITPGSPITQEKLDKTLANLKMLGLKAKYNPSIMARHGYLAGPDEQRISDIHEFFADKTVKAIWCIRGGYGCPRLLPKLDFKLIKRNPKILIGYSDVTALLAAILEKTKMISFHGPMTASTFTPFALAHLKAVLMEGRSKWLIDPALFENGQYSIRSGTASGPLVGGNLSLLSALVGTPYEICYKNKIVFIEEIGEKPYRIDRMLTQLRQGSDLKEAAAIVLGVFESCEAKKEDASLSLKETLTDRLYDLGIPVYYGFPVGHISDQCTLPIGGEAHFDGATGKLTLLGASVQ
jgi:muramoyltetrapeptide carboxypeptidase